MLTAREKREPGCIWFLPILRVPAAVTPWRIAVFCKRKVQGAEEEVEDDTGLQAAYDYQLRGNDKK